MKLVKKLYRFLFLPIFKKIEFILFKIFEIENSISEIENSVKFLSEKAGEQSYIINNCITDLEHLKEQDSTLQYLSDILPEKSYLIDQNSIKIKELMFELEKNRIRISSILNEVNNGQPCIYQVVPVLKQGDAIGNYSLFIDEVLRKNSINSKIYTYQNNIEGFICGNAKELVANKNDIILLHMAAANDFAEIIDAYPSKKVLVYHNITPSEFFHKYDIIAEESTCSARKQLERVLHKIDYSIVDSQYNKIELLKLGCECKIYINNLPVISKKNENEAVQCNITKDEGYNILFVGRMVPNKKIEDIIDCFKIFNEKYDINSTLYLVGSFDRESIYGQKLLAMCSDMDNIVFTGHISDAELDVYYKKADLFLCMSEHEGFCVPLIEAMSYQIPIVAYKCTAIPDTLGNGGILIENKDPQIVSDIIHEVLSNQIVRDDIINNQCKMISRYDPEAISDNLLSIIKDIMEV